MSLPPSRGSATENPDRRRLPVGQLLVRLLAEFRRVLLEEADRHGYGDLRPAHLQITGNIGTKGIRLTALAARAQLSLAATSELVNELQSLGYLMRKPDPADARAKLILPTPRGLQLLSDASDKVRELEQLWGTYAGEQHFEAAMWTLQDILDATRRPAGNG
ncbi:MarR family winged helix-turn-helix transcriptional regulator [Arthrobacter sp. zg-Y769]|uniref:MarR family winged helix-turn-helix transcriptional regulator n=1 Tax=Arthrobacter sp. zg-Y769 TaxID=2894191 RepID=UPI001E5B6C1E|nr:MarR family transcriptional regulator [Arthrobacter sp. zg-Y769]MCC9205528.1 MarR family transcriptional regulator [Arthrobacter sp. zg-Y769]